MSWRVVMIGIAVFGVALLSGHHWSAADDRCAMTYEIFETAVAHLDAETCPDEAMNDKAFCRISVGGDQAHVFYFANDGQQCLLKVESFDDEDMKLKFKR